jgi:Ca2+-binding RTX toxin-like protein
MPRLFTHEQKRKLSISGAQCGESRTLRSNREERWIIPPFDSTESQFFGQIKGDVFLTAGDDIYYGRDGNIEGGVYGFDGDDLLVGGSSTEKLFGGTSNDILRGGAGDDLIDGGRGNDLLNGGADDDIFRFSSDILGDLQQDLDRINNFQSNDSFDFSDYLNAGGTISFIRGQRDLLVNLNNEDVLIVRGDLDAAEQQLLQIL